MPSNLARGTTLIEVLLGLVLLSTLLASVAIARGRFLRQWADADRRLRLVHVADTLMTGWMAGPSEAVPQSGRGAVPEGGVWRTRSVPDAGATRAGVQVVRLELFATADAAAPAVSLDFVVRDTRAATQPAVGTGP